MSTDDVHGDDMDHSELSDEQLAALLDGTAAESVDHPVADALVRAREQLRSEPAPIPGAALSEFLGVDHVAPTPGSAADPTIDPVVIDTGLAAEPAPRRTPVLASLTAFIGTLTGKVLIGGGVAVASIGGAHAVGVVDIPGLPEVDDSSITETLDDDSDSRGPDDADGLAALESLELEDEREAEDLTTSTTVPVTITTTTTAPSPTSTVGPPPTSPSTSTSSTTSTTTTTTPTPTTTTKAYTVTGVGTTTVSVTGAQILLVSAVPAAGWSLDETQQTVGGVESRYVQAELETRIDFEIEDGQLRVRVRERNDATDERTERFEYFPL